MAERFDKVNEQEIRELLDNTTPKIPCLSTSLETLSCAWKIFCTLLKICACEMCGAQCTQKNTHAVYPICYLCA